MSSSVAEQPDCWFTQSEFPWRVKLSLVWSLTMSLPPLLGWGRYVIENNGMSCAPAWEEPPDFGYNITLFVLGFFFPLAIIITTGVKILFLIRKHLSAMSSQLGESAKKKEEKLSEMVRGVRM